MNISNKTLARYELEALSLGLKFDTGKNTNTYADYVLKNYTWTNSDVEKGFIQGVLACYSSLASEQPSAIPKRYREALNNLRKDDSVMITKSDKGGGVVIMNKADYSAKMMNLLSDTSTYEKKYQGYNNITSKNFNKEARKILRKSEKGKKLLHLLEENPNPPRMRGLPKTHKPNIPMRPITSGIGSAPHALAKRLARPFSNALGSINGAHLRNSADLIQRLNSVNFRNKKMASFDVKSLFTNVPVEGAIEAVKRASGDINEENLPIPREDYINLVELCVKFGAFTFEGQEYSQHKGLAMGSPLSAVMACLYMETLETDKFIRIMGTGSTWLRIPNISLCSDFIISWCRRSPFSSKYASIFILLEVVEVRI
ncbi:uncharacterized protein LOC135093961 [Scylla paramamosain]|uniref:uncharacterized protein LOC135093961 n=1 Tax=Scylla paramamosain TaxID=85552 RepID=UPI003082F512